MQVAWGSASGLLGGLAVLILRCPRNRGNSRVDRVGFMAHAGYLCGLGFYDLRPNELKALERRANEYPA